MSPHSPAERPPARGALLRWFLSAATLNVPQAAGPVAFALLALSLTGETSGGAALMLAMTLAQVAGAVPITRLGRGLAPARFLRLLVACRTAALASMALLAALEAPFGWLIAAAAVAGSVNGAAFGYLRSLLNQLAPASRLPRALGISATLNELTFVLAPVAASGLGTVSPVACVLAIAVLGAAPALLVPHVERVHADGAPPADGARPADGSILTPAILLWLTCAAVGGAAVAAIEIGAVALALAHGYAPALAILFTVPLCLASVSGGIWVSVRNRQGSAQAVVAQLLVMTMGSALLALGGSIATAVAGAILIGAVLAPLATHYSLVLDRLAPPRRRAEAFALLRTANALGVIVASALLTAIPLSAALIVIAGLMLGVTAAIGIASTRAHGRIE